jgi:hypothetical protein
LSPKARSNGAIFPSGDFSRASTIFTTDGNPSVTRNSIEA